MTAAKPGSWVVRSPKNDSHAFDVYASDEEHATKLHHGFWGGKETAQLIAAAPELLAALEANHEWHMQYDERDAYADSELCEKNLAAIAKARGAK